MENGRFKLISFRAYVKAYTDRFDLWKRGDGMANQQYLDLLKQGVQVWNKWRNEGIVNLIFRVEIR